MADIVDLSVLVLLGLTVVPVLDRAVISRDTAVNLRLCSADRACKLLSCQISVFAAYGIGRRHRVVRQLVVFGDLAYQICCSLPVGKFLSQKGMEYCSGGVQSLQFVLNIQSRKHVFRKAHRKVGRIRIIWRSIHVCGDDVRVFLPVMLCKPIRS